MPVRFSFSIFVQINLNSSLYYLERGIGCLIVVKVKTVENEVEKLVTAKMFRQSLEMLINASGQLFPKTWNYGIDINKILEMLPTGARFNATSSTTGNANDATLTITDVVKVKKMA